MNFNVMWQSECACYIQETNQRQITLSNIISTSKTVELEGRRSGKAINQESYN